MTLICGLCALETSVAIADRIALALSRVIGQEYTCPKCNRTHDYRLHRIVPMDAQFLLSAPPMDEYVQVTLFDL